MVLVTKQKRHTTANPRNKRRQGSHHNQNERYLKTYWPYLPIAGIVALGLFFNSFLGSAHKSVLGYATSMSINSLLVGTNNQRAANGLGALAINSQLNSAAQAKANDMVARDYWAHVTPDGQQPWVFFTNAGYNYQTAGENLAYGFDTADDAITAWMNSPEHKANILNNTYVDVGFGFANSPNYQGTGPETIVVAEYGSPQPGSAPVASSNTPQSTASTQPAATQTPTPQAATPTPTAQSKPEDTSKVPQANTTDTTVAQQPVTSKSVSRVQLLSGTNASWSMFAVSTIATLSLAIFFLRHGLFWHRALRKGEKFIIKHKMLDIVLVGAAVAGFVLSRSVGLIY